MKINIKIVARKKNRKIMKVNYIYLALVLVFSTNFIIADEDVAPVKVEAENKTTEVKEESADKKEKKGKDKKEETRNCR